MQINQYSNNDIIYLIDFDSTFTQVEALDELASLVLENHSDKTIIEEKISSLTVQAMNGTLPFDEALKQRLKLLSFNKTDIQKLTEILKLKISVSFKKNIDFITTHADHIYIISGGFKEFIIPVVKLLGIKEDHVYANEFIFNEEGTVIGYDENNLLSRPKGKVQLVQSLHLSGEISVIGDGYTDFEIKEAGLASTFYLFIENVRREHLFKLADKVIASLDEIL